MFEKFNNEFCLFTDIFKFGPFGFVTSVLVFLLMLWNYLGAGEANTIKQILYNNKYDPSLLNNLTPRTERLEKLLNF